MVTTIPSLVRALWSRARSVTFTLSALALALAAASGATGAAAPASAQEARGNPIVALDGYHVSVFARGTTYTHPDSIVADGSHIFIGYQNVTAKDGTDNKSSTIVEYNLNGKAIRTFSVSGHNDGLRVNPADHLLWATSNEDGNPVLHTINPDTGAVVAYHFSSAPHGGGYDDLMYLDGKMFVVASNPTLNSAGVNVFPAVDEVSLQGNVAVVTPVLMGNATATDLTTNSTVTLNEVDPDSLSVDTQGDLVLVDQGGSDLVFMHNPGTAQQTVTRLPTGSQLDDTVWSTSTRGQIFVVDGAQNVTYIIRTSFTPGTVFTELPSDSGVTGLVGTLDPKTGLISPIAIGFGSPTGMMFLPDGQQHR